MSCDLKLYFDDSIKLVEVLLHYFPPMSARLCSLEKAAIRQMLAIRKWEKKKH